MLSPDQFARVKALFDQLCDLPAAEQRAALGRLQEDGEVLAELHLLLDKTMANVDHTVQPMLKVLAALAETPCTGDVLGAWTLHEEIGQGGMGKVFLARRSDGQFDQLAAIKLLSGRPSAIEQRYLARERQILASLTHPNIARLYDGGSTPQGQPYLVMEYVQGLQIHRYCDQHGLSLAARLRLIIDVCAAVVYAHQQLIVHCDLKPGNILVTSDGRPVLLDFGVSRLVDAADWGGSTDDAVLNTNTALTGAAYPPRYASPEQKARGQVGTASDIYSLGLVLTELLDLEWPDDQRRLCTGCRPSWRRSSNGQPISRWLIATAASRNLLPTCAVIWHMRWFWLGQPLRSTLLANGCDATGVGAQRPSGYWHW
ncbi:MAG: serine/threonine protein kinase [Ahniella sp.]|nr:serine/threonine protein kinase [Ahniella sp.]